MTRPLQTRKPTGKPSWPILLLAGVEKSGKSYGAALASKSDLIGRTYWVTIGEDQPDEYGQIGDFDIVEHDGKYRSILEAILAAGEQPAPEHGVPLLVVDSMSRLWDLLSQQAQDTAQKRAEAAARKAKRPLPDEEVPISMDLWNAARSQWDRVMDAIRAFPGPVILTGRLEIVTVVGPDGKPTKEKTSKVQGHKSFAYDVGAIVEMPARGETWLTGVRSVALRLPERLRMPDFTVDHLWRKLGLADAQTSPREHSAPRLGEPEPKPLPYDPAIGDEWAAQVADATRLGHPNTDTSESDTLAGVLIRAQRAGVLRRLVDDPARVEHPKTVEQLIDERRRILLRLEQEARELRARQEAAAA